MQSAYAQIGDVKLLPQNEDVVIVQPKTAQIVQPITGQMQQQLNEFCDLFLKED